jgi:molecular chaperone GrpE
MTDKELMQEIDTEGIDNKIEDVPVSDDNAPEEETEASPDSKLQAAEQEAKETYNRLLRVSAEFENYKKRSARETENFKKFANESLVRDLLPVADDMERAIASSRQESSSHPVLDGVTIIFEKLLKILDSFGVKPVESAVGKPFNPGFHEAAMVEESEEYPENTVIREFQKGYMLHDRLLRPAMVVVSKEKKN